MKEKTKKQIKEKFAKTLELSKNIQEPRNEEEQKRLDNIMEKINDLSNYLDEISIYVGSDGKKYKYEKNKLVGEDGKSYIKMTDNTDYVFSIFDDNGKEYKYSLYKDLEKN